MSTRCRIGIRNEDGTITSIYCHHDGYTEGVGKVLRYHYKSEDKIRQLLALGDISSLGTEPIENPNAFELPGPSASNEEWFKTWEQLHPENMCGVYRTRGEDCPAETSKDTQEYVDLAKSCWGIYAYLFEEGKWHLVNGKGKVVAARASNSVYR